MKTAILLLGAHVSASGGVHEALFRGQEIGATAIQLFTRNQRQWHAEPLSSQEIRAWEEARAMTGIESVMSHDSYLINLGSTSGEIIAKSRHSFRAELERCHQLHIPFLNFHPGVATVGSAEQCLEVIIESLLQLEELASQGATRLLLETTAGQGKSVGHQFEQLGVIVRAVQKKIPIGVCIDTCHVFVAGYDIRTAFGWEKTLQAFDEMIGLSHLYAFHLNDSLKDLGSRVDRHAPLGKGKIGIESFQFLMQDERTRNLPKFLETPDGPSLWKEEIAMLREFGNRALS